MAERADNMIMYNILIGANSAGTETGNSLVSTQHEKFVDKGQYSEMLTAEAKKRAEQYVRKTDG